LGLYLRGEKSEVSHPVTAWASQTGKGLLFFNKKGESDRTQPAGVIALYDATDLKKASPHEFTFEILGHKHSFKANSDAERDGWYQSIEKSIELGKASKESVRDSEGYKAEIEKLSMFIPSRRVDQHKLTNLTDAPNVAGGAVAAAKTGASLPKKSTEVDSAEPKRIGSSDGEDEELKKKTKSRSTSRGMLNKLKGKKEEHDVKKEEEKEEKAVDKELQKTDDETVVPVAAPVTTETPAFQPTTSKDQEASRASCTDTDHFTVMPIAAEEKPVEALPVAPVAATEPTTEEKPKISKRGSIFGRIPSAWGSLKSPTKEKELDLKPEVPAKDAAVSDAAPQLPETTTTEPIETPVAAPATDATTPAISEPAAEATKTETATPSKEKKNFLSGLSFMNKRERSTSPSAAKEQPLKTETAAPIVPAKDEVVATEPVKVEEPATEVAPVVAPTTEAVEEPKTSEATSPAGTPTANKRQSMLGNLGRRASKALNRIQPKKENAAPTTDKTVEEDAAAPVVTDKKVDEPVVSDPETIAARAVGAPATDSTGTAITTEENKPETVGVNPSTQVTASA
jgi:hypothetical protein